MDRRNFLKSVSSGAVLAAMPHLLNAQTTSKPPNIFMIFGDDLPKRDFGCYGNPVVQTPRIDQLAAQGMRFNNMFTTSPTCVPSRVSLYTGLYPIRNGAHPNHSQVKPGTKSLPHYMKALGYRVILLGKKHIKPWESFPFEYYPDGSPTLTGPGPDLERILKQPGPKPLCIILCRFGTHVPWHQDSYHYDPDKVDLPPYLVDTPPTRELRARYYSAVTASDEAVGRVLDLLEKSSMAANTLVIYTDDHGTNWPHEKHNLYDAGINVPFIVRWPEKIKPGTVSDALLSYVDIVPTFIELAGGNVAQVVQNCGGQELDGKSFLPLLLAQKTDHHPQVYACYTWGVMQAYPMRAIRTKNHKYIWNIDSHFRYQWPPDTGWWGETSEPIAFTQWSLPEWPIWQSWREKAKTDPAAAQLLRNLQFRPPEELYDLRNDPDEMNNIADDPTQEELLIGLRAKLKAWMEQQQDTADSAYHGEVGKTRFLDEFYGRQTVVNVRMAPVGLEAARVELTSPLWQAEIHYTLNGAEPTRNSKLYTTPFPATPPFLLKAKGFFQGNETPLKVVECHDVDYQFHYNYHFKPVSW